MNSNYPMLFERGKIGRLEIKNRIVKAATGTYLANPDMTVTDRQIKFYEEVARGGAGLVFVDNAIVTNDYHMGVTAISDKYIPGLSLLAGAISDHGAKSGLQLSHPGRDGVFVGGTGAKSASRMQWEEWYQYGLPVPQELTIEEIHEIVASFGDAAKRARIAGFDMVEVHAATGCLPCSFLSPAQNRRNDMYGGSLQNRMRFIIEVSRSIKQKAGSDFPLSIRMSTIEYEPGGIELEESIEVAKALEQNGVDVINATSGTHAEAEYCSSSMLMPLALNVPSAAEIKKAVKIPVMVAGSIPTPELAEKTLADGSVDFIALGRPLFADPEWPKKAKEGRAEDIRPCIRCNDGCHDRGMLSTRVVMCTMNPALFKHETLAVTKAEQPKNVAVIGAGPAGMEAARVCALRGHNVTLFEKRELGGILIEASAPEFKADIRRLINYYKIQLEKLNINIVKKEADVDVIKDGNFDSVIVAIGAAIKKPDVRGIDKPIVTNVLDVLGGKANTGRRVVVIGGGVTGAEVGLFLAEQGKEVAFAEMLDQIMSDMGVNRRAYNKRLFAQNVTVHTGRRLDEVLDDGAVIVDIYGEKEELPADSIVLASGFSPQFDLRQRIEEGTGLEVHMIGDCVESRMIFDAVHEGFLTARMI